MRMRLWRDPSAEFPGAAAPRAIAAISQALATRAPLAVLGALVLASTAPVNAQDDLSTLRKQLAEQRALIQAQQQQLERQAQELERMSQRLESVAAGKGVASGAPPVASARESPSQVTTASGGTVEPQRDGVGDLNSAAVSAGDFPGAIRLPGKEDVSLAIGGLVKTVAIVDSKAETMGADFLPSTLGTKSPDKDGAFSIDSTLTRVFLDGRAASRDGGQLRGYVEADLNSANDGSLGVKLRHAYGSWKNSYGTLLAGQTWSTFMDTKILPEGLTEPTVSGAIFVRQPEVRWTQPLDASFILHAAIEDPNSSDIFDSSSTPRLGRTKLPDAILGLEYVAGNRGHLRLNAIARDLEVDLPDGSSDSQAAWGFALSGGLNVLQGDRWVFSGTYGRGLGRYLLGIPSTAGSVLDPVTKEIALRDNWGTLTTYKRQWNQSLRSSFMAGYARSRPLEWQPSDTFQSSFYAAANLMWQVLPYLTLGVEYAYGERTLKDGSSLNNNRVGVGFQFF